MSEPPISRTTIITGANGSTGLHTVSHILTHIRHASTSNTCMKQTLILTVRSASPLDPNTNALRTLISKYPTIQTKIVELDLANPKAVKSLIEAVKTGIEEEKWGRVAAIVCGAMFWDLVGDGTRAVNEAVDKTIQVTFLSHAALVLGLLDYFASDTRVGDSEEETGGGGGGRVILLSSVAHYRRKSAMSKFIPDIPMDLGMLERPVVAEKGEEVDRGFERYANAKLVTTVWGVALGEYLRVNPKYKHIKVLVMNPGNMLDSRTFRKNTPMSIQVLQKWVMNPLLPVLRRVVDSTMRTCEEAGRDIAELAVGEGWRGKEGYYTILEADEPDEICGNEGVKRRVWEWAGEVVGVEVDGLT